MKQSTVLPILLSAVALTALFWIANLILGIHSPIEAQVWSLLYSLLVCGVLGQLTRHSVLSTRLLMVSVFVVYFVIGHFNILIEAYIFDVSSRERTLLELLRGLFISAAIAPILVHSFGQNREIQRLEFAPRSLLGWGWRILVGDVLYLFLYSVAGFTLVTVYPQLLEFYTDKIPPLDLAIKTQLFLRGFLFMGIALVILRTINAPLKKQAWLTGLTFAVLGGIAPLIPPNELMPGYIRLGHLFEVGISNFLYGWLLAYLLGHKRITTPEPA